MRFVCETVKDLSSTRSIFDRGMETQYFREQAQRVRDIAEKADPFTKKRLLTLAEYYEARALESPRPPAADQSSDFAFRGDVRKAR